MEGIVTNFMKDLPIVCKDDDFVRFYARANETCGEYTKTFFAIGAKGYIQNPGSSGIKSKR